MTAQPTQSIGPPAMSAMAASAPASAPRKGLGADQVDAHLVMNVLNQIAAQDFKERGMENPMLFALSDYLREALQLLGRCSSSLHQEVKLLLTHAQLTAVANRSEIDLTVDSQPQFAPCLEPGCLAGIADCLLKASRPQIGGKWRLHLFVGVDAASPDAVAVSMELLDLARSHALEATSAQRRLNELCRDRSQPLPVRGIRWSQDQPGHLKLVCRITSVP